MNDAIPSADDLMGWVEQALRWCRDNDVPSLAKSPFAETFLVKECLLPGEARTERQLGLSVYALLRWAVESLRPRSGSHHWNVAQAPAWRFYNVLVLYYFEGLSGAEVADKMGIGEDSFYSKKQGPRIQALRRVVATLAAELNSPAWRAARWRCALNVRWDALSCDERLLCGLAALLRGSLPRELLYFRGANGAWPDLDASLGSLLDSGLLAVAHDSNFLILPPDFRTIIVERLPPETRRLAHERAAHYYERQASYLEAAYHFYHLREREGRKRAAQLLLDHWEGLKRQHTLRELGKFLKLFERPDPPDPSWYRLKVLMGDVALETEGVERAIEAYTEALGTKERLVKALAHYRLGEAEKRSEKLVEEALENYRESLRLLEQMRTPDPLLGEVLIDYSWFFIQERKDLRRASSILRRACRVMPDEPAMRAKWYNALAGLHARLKNKEKTLTYRLKALVAAKASGNRLLQSKILKNLGVDYAELAQDFDLALEYPTEAFQLAWEEGAEPLAGLCLKDIGGGHVLRWGDPEPGLVLSEAARRDYHTAIGYYQQAYHIFAETQHHNWRAGVYLDLAEAYAALVDGLNACRYYLWGCAIARAFGHRIYLDFAEKLLQRWPIIRNADIMAKLEGDEPQHERQRKALEFVARYGSITKAQHRAQHPSISSATATRDLADLVDDDKKLLVKVGSGPSTRYTFPPFGEGNT